MSGQRWDVMMVREYKGHDGQPRNFWTKIGAAFTNQSGSISVQLDAMPVDGKMVLQVPLSKEERAAKFGSHGQAQRQQAGFAPQYRGGGSGGSQASRYRQAPPAPPSYPAQPSPQQQAEDEYTGGEDYEDQLPFPK